MLVPDCYRSNSVDTAVRQKALYSRRFVSFEEPTRAHLVVRSQGITGRMIDGELQPEDEVLMRVPLIHAFGVP